MSDDAQDEQQDPSQPKKPAKRGESGAKKDGGNKGDAQGKSPKAEAGKRGAGNPDGQQ